LQVIPLGQSVSKAHEPHSPVNELQPVELVQSEGPVHWTQRAAAQIGVPASRAVQSLFEPHEPQ
jgi:hypothetical protein